MHARPLDRRPLVSPLVRRPPPFTPRFVSCGVVAKAMVEVGLASPCYYARATVARNLAGHRDRRYRKNVGVVIIAFVTLIVFCLSLVI